MERKINILALTVLAFLIVGLSYLLYRSGFLFDVNVLTDFIQGFGILSYIAFFFIVLLEVVAAPIPGAILYTVGGILFGSFIGGTIALVANVIGAGIAFYIGRHILLKKEEKSKKDRLDKMVNKYGGYSIFLLRINPLTSSDVFSFLAGFLRMNFRKFIIGTTLGLLPLIYIQSYLGAEVLTENSFLLSVFIVASVAYLFIFVLILLNRNFLKWINQKLRNN